MASQKLILVVEDNELNRMMLCEILSSDYQVVEAANGQEALDVLEKYRDGISLILLDINMPVMDGYEFLSIVKADPTYSAIPVIVTTQSDRESDEVTALSHGATDFVAKPYKPQVILHRVASIINLRETAAMINLFQHDQLTGLYSKAFFYQKAKERLLQCPDREFDIVCSDIENFKLINDVFGLPAGDSLLREVANLYLELVGEDGICGRFHADQFCCLLERRENYSNQMFADLNSRISKFFIAKNVSMKWGIYSIENRDISMEQMCDRAFLAAHSIKGQYGKYYATYDDELRSVLLREQDITDCMESAVDDGQFEIYLQPKYRVEDTGLAGAEALIRWNHPEWGLQSPAQFIPLFEKNGFITKLDQYVWEQACMVLRDWDQKGYPPVEISVNVSRADIYNADLEDILMEIVKKYDLKPSRLHLEITESAYTEDPAQIIEKASHLRALGFIIEMDDFGSGYSSLNMLNQMPIDVLKLDMKFIQTETAKPLNQGILHFVMGLARWMNLKVVAEGVETKEQLDRLRDIGCDFVQGYYFAKPMPCAEFEKLLRRRVEEEARAVVTAQTFRADRENKFLLIADEDGACRAMARRAFEETYHILEADSGEKALYFIASYGNEISAAILSMTLKQPDGFEILEVLRREKGAWHIPIIATAREGEAENRALRLGADDFVRKPYAADVLRLRTMRAQSIARAQEQKRMLQDEANRDYLTGLLNRRGLENEVRTLEESDMPVAVYLFDLDNLKDVNDALGHSRGDALIKKFGDFLRGHTRGTDILSRYGGDEFIVIMKKMGGADIVQKKGEEMCRMFQEVILMEDMSASCSAGIAIWDQKISINEIIDRADQALYCAKTSRKGRCCLWER